MSTSGSSRLSRSMSGSSNGSLLPPPSPTAQTASHTVSAWQPIATQAHTNTHPHCHQSLMRLVPYKFGDKTAILGDRESWEKRSGMSLKNANSQIERIAMRSPTYGECFAGYIIACRSVTTRKSWRRKKSVGYAEHVLATRKT